MIIGLTGGVGSGKSTVLEILKEKYNAHILEADKIAYDLMLPGMFSYDEIVKEFGNEIILEDGLIDRKALAGIVFNDKEKLNKLNTIVHPQVKKEIERQIKEIQEKDKDAIIVLEAALLIEAGYKDICDMFWCVYTKYPIREERLINSRGYTKEKIKEIVNNQLSEEEFAKESQYLIDNSKSFNDTLKQIEKIINTLLE